MNEKYLIETKKQLIQSASLIPNWKNINNEDLLTKYLYYEEQENEVFRSAYISALILNFWSYIYRWAAQTKGKELNEIDYYEWLINSIEKALKYIKLKETQIKDHSIKSEQILNECLNKAVERELPILNKDKRRANYNIVNVDAITYNLHVNNDYNDGYDLVIGGREDKYNDLNIEFLISYFLRKNMKLEACLIYLIVYSDCFTEKSCNLKLKALVGTFNDEYYAKEIKSMLGDEDYKTLKNMGLTTLRKHINIALNNLKASPILKESL